MSTQPAQGEGTNRRRFPRHLPGNMGVPVRVDDQTAQLIDVSLIGMRVETEREYTPGTLLPVELTLGDRSTVFKGLVRRAEPTCVIDFDRCVDVHIRFQLAVEFMRDARTDPTLLEDLVTLLCYSNWVVQRVGRS